MTILLEISWQVFENQKQGFFQLLYILLVHHFELSFKLFAFHKAFKIGYVKTSIEFSFFIAQVL